MTIFEDFTTKTSGSRYERKNVAITWHYRNATPEEGAPSAALHLTVGLTNRTIAAIHQYCAALTEEAFNAIERGFPIDNQREVCLP